MDIIARATTEGAHLCKDKKLAAQTWEQFQKISEDKKIFLFGIGGGMRYFLRNCYNDVKITGVVDNDQEKQNHKLGWYCEEAWHMEYEDIIVCSPNDLRYYPRQEIVVLITVLRGYEQIVEQLRQMGIVECFILLIMEANRANRIEEGAAGDAKAQRDQYLQWATQHAIEKCKVIMYIGEYGGHARAITCELLKFNKELDIVWIVRKPDVEMPDGVRLVNENNRKSYIYEMETARIWLYDVLVPDYIIKREGQIYIQVKHWSSITLKKFYLDDKSSCTSLQIEERIRRDGDRMDYLFSGSEFDEWSCESGLNFHGKAVRVGSARSDILFDNSVKKKVTETFHFSYDKHIALYVPTYRKKDFDNGKCMDISLDMELFLKELQKQWGGDWVLLVRLHPFIRFVKNGFRENERIISAADYPNSIELVAACDIMITDYSSIMFEGAFIKKPVFLYAPDKREYINGERGLLLDYELLPFPQAESNEELIQCIRRFDRQRYEQRIVEYLNRYGVHEDGYASRRAAEFLIKLIFNRG